MPDRIVVALDRKRYTWDGSRWYGTEDYTLPPLTIVNRLNSLIADRVAAEDAAVTDPEELLSRAKRAQAGGQLERATRLARRASAARPGHAGTAAVLCSVLRQRQQPADALAVADRFRGSGYLPILTSRAAALCDLGQWSEALAQIRQVLAIGVRAQGTGGGEALAVYNRIRVSAPQLFDA